MRNLAKRKVVPPIVLLLFLTACAARQGQYANPPTAPQLALRSFAQKNAILATSVHSLTTVTIELNKSRLLTDAQTEPILRKAGEAQSVVLKITKAVDATNELDAHSAQSLAVLVDSLLAVVKQAAVDTNALGIRSDSAKQQVLDANAIVVAIASQMLTELQREGVVQ